MSEELDALADKLYGIEGAVEDLTEQLNEALVMVEALADADAPFKDLPKISEPLPQQGFDPFREDPNSIVVPINEGLTQKEAEILVEGMTAPLETEATWRQRYEEGEQITFIPFDFGGWTPRPTMDGLHKYFEVTVNGAQYKLVLNEVQTVPAAVFHFYQNAVAMHIKSEDFKRGGPEHAPWSNPDRKAWHYEPSAPTFWIDEDGRYLNPETDYILIGVDGKPDPSGMPVAVPKGILIKGNRRA